MAPIRATTRAAEVFHNSAESATRTWTSAMRVALDAMVSWMQELFDLGKATALVLASSCVDLRVTQVSNQTRGVHAALTASVLTRRE